MTNYHFESPDALPNLAWQEAKEKRRQQLERVRRRRKIIAARFQAKQQKYKRR